MTFDELLGFIKWENERLSSRDDYASRTENILAGVVKLSEEVGELSNEVLVNLGLCRADKMKEGTDDLEKEWADCFLVLLLLADRMDIDIKSVISKKMEIVKNRKY